MKVGILFDLDGTLLNSLEDLRDAVNYALAQFSCPQRSLEEIRRFVGNGVMNLLRQALPGKPTDPSLDSFLEVYTKYYAAHNQDKTRPYDGVLDALEEIKKKYPVAIVSNKHDSAVKTMCRFFFGDIYARGESGDCLRKPAPDMVHKAMAQLQVDACIYVGDSEVDVLTAKNADVPCLSVLWGFRDQACLLEAGAKHFCHAPNEMEKILSAMVEEYYGK